MRITADVFFCLDKPKWEMLAQYSYARREIHYATHVYIVLSFMCMNYEENYWRQKISVNLSEKTADKLDYLGCSYVRRFS